MWAIRTSSLFPEREDFGSHGMSWQELGAKISVDPLFRFGTNVEFVRVRGEGEIEFRIFERGCGPTTSSGTGTCASSAAAIRLRGAATELTALAEGGAQTVHLARHGGGDDADRTGGDHLHGRGVCLPEHGATRPTLRKGSRVAVVSPASAAREERVGAGVEALRRFGYEPVVMPHTLSRGPLYYAGTAEERVADLACGVCRSGDRGSDLHARGMGVGGAVAAARCGRHARAAPGQSEGVRGL